MNPLADRNKLFTLIGILLALFLGAIDQTIVSTALPKIVDDLEGVRRYAWVATAYLLASTVMVPIYGRLADSYDRKTVELWAIGLFLGGSFLCGLAGEFGSLPLIGDGMNQLILFRAIQGLGGAGLFALAFIIIADLFPPAIRGKYQGLVGAVFGLSSVLGPLIGGFLTDYGGGLIPGVAGWRWIFYVNVPFGAVALWFIIRRMPSLPPHGPSEGLNYPSAFMLVAGLTPLILALQLDKSIHPWSSSVTLGLFAASAVFLTLFSIRSLRNPNPILDFSLFRNRVFSVANLALFFLGAAFLSIIIFLPLFMVNVVGVSATSAGISLIPLSLGMTVGSTLAGNLVTRYGRYKLFLLGGGLVLAGGLVLLSRMGPGVSFLQVTLYMVICGLGAGPTLPLYPLAIQNAVERNRIGQATSASQFFRQIGGAVGAAVMGTVMVGTLTARMHSGPAPGDMPPALPAEQMDMPSRNLNPKQASEQIHLRFEEQYTAVARAVDRGDPDTASRLLTSLPVADSVRMGLVRAAESRSDDRRQRLSAFRTNLHRFADLAAAAAEKHMRSAYSDAVTRIYFYTLFLVLAGWVSTVFLPELPLRRTH